MELYLQQLIEDIEANIKRSGSDKLSDPMDERELDLDNHFEQVEQFIYGPTQKLSEIVGIEQVQLPPIEKLSDTQATALYREMELLLQAYHFFPDFPEGLSTAIKYRLLREKWDSEQVFMTAGETHLEFCSYDPDSCNFPQEYCHCKKYDEENNQLPDDFEDGAF